MPSACLIEDAPADADVYNTVSVARSELAKAARGDDDRIVVLVGPHAIHETTAAMEYAKRLRGLAESLKSELIIVMRAFAGQPAGDGDWDGMINDPDLNGSCQINKGFLKARKLLLDINRLGLPVACEYQDTISPQFIADLVSWSGNDASTVESHLHHELASGLSTPVGFKNGTTIAGGGGGRAAVEAVNASAGPHAFLSVSKQGVAGIVETTGNRDCHVVLHGSATGPNHSEEAVRGVCDSLAALQLPARVMVDCGSYNARQSPSVQAEVAESMAARIAQGDTRVFGLVLHSFLVSGRQDLASGGAPIYGMSVTEPCMDWSATASVLETLAGAVRQRRAAKKAVASPGGSSNGKHTTPFAELGELEATDNLRIKMIRPLRPPACVIEELESDASVRQLVLQARCDISRVLYGASDKLLVVVGPSTVHDPRAAMEYAARLRTAAQACEAELLVVMQVNLETSNAAANGSWKGMINDPDLDGSCQINKGFRQARKLLLDINRLGLPASTEYLDTISPQFIADLVSWAVVGAGTAESEAHRDLASGLSTPVGFKNGTGGGSEAAVEAVNASAGPHAFLSVSKQGVAGIVETTGNRDCHVVLHGSATGPNHSEEAVRGVCDSLAALQLPARVMVDCGSYNARQSPSVQAEVAESMAARIAQGDTRVFGLVLHSFLVSGRQDLASGGAPIYGMSVTEPCMDWSATASVLETLAGAVRQRRAANGAAPPGKKQRSA